jgi:putative ABC transport system permease protein
MRKLLGVSRWHLIGRFMGEAILFSLVAGVFGLALVEIVLKLTPINDLFGKPLSLGLTEEPLLLLGLLGLCLTIGVLSGLYPAAYLSSISPLSALTSNLGGKGGGFRLREILVLTQFMVSVIVIACTLFMAMQMRYIAQKDLGFDKKNRVIINLHGLDIIEKYWVIKNELTKDSHIKGIATCSHMIGIGQGFPVGPVMVDNKDGVPEMYKIMRMQATEDFPRVMGMQLAAGRDFSKKLLTDMGTNFIVNETLARNRGWKDPLGKKIQGGKVIGVLKDFHHASLLTAIEPFAIYPFNEGFDFKSVPAQQRVGFDSIMVIHIADHDVQQTLRMLQEKFSGYDPKHPFEFTFLEDAINKLYMSEERLMKMTGIFSAICILISCLGLFGLAAYATEQRSKEIGIRKVLGASAAQIILMLSRKILWLVFAGSVAACIIAYFAMEEWLSGFAYRAGLQPWVFIVAAAIVIAVAFVTIALQSYRTAQTNPARTLRYE